MTMKWLFKFQESASANGIPMLVLRLMLGFGFAAHGWAKLSRGPEGFGNILETIGVPFPHFMAWATTFVELIGGTLLMAGAFVVLLSVPLAVTMLTAMFTVHFQYGFSSIKIKAITSEGAQFGPPGYEINLLYITGLLVLVLGGSGKWSIDQGRQRKKR
jgi:putative oxidoreductase